MSLFAFFPRVSVQVSHAPGIPFLPCFFLDELALELRKKDFCFLGWKAGRGGRHEDMPK